MVEELPRPLAQQRSKRPRGLVPLAQRAAELNMTVAALRRYVNQGSVTGQTRRIGNRIYVARNLNALLRTPRRSKGESSGSGRTTTLTRETGETRVTVEINLDGQGQYRIQTGNTMLDHLLAQLARHGLLDLTISAQGDAISDNHHLVEDVAIALGRALRQAIGEGKGIYRMGSALVPLDESLAQVALDASGRGYAVVETQLEGAMVGDFPGELVSHFLERVALEGNMTLHARVLTGVDPHHKAEALFKAFAKALRTAVQLDPRAAGAVPSTKGTVSG